MACVVRLRRDTTANWTAEDPVLASGEPGVDLDTGELKIGDGVTAWSALDSISGGGSSGVDEDAYWQVLAAGLDPAATHMVGNWPFTTDRDLWATGAWNLAIGGQLAERRLDLREPPALSDPGLAIPAGTTLGQNQSDGGAAMLLVTDPSAVSYADPRAKFFERVMRLPSLALELVEDSLVSDQTAYTKFVGGPSFYLGRPPMLDVANRAVRTLTRDIPEGASQTVRWQGYGHTQPAAASTMKLRLWLSREAGYSGDLDVQIEQHTSLAPNGTTFITTVTIPEANLPAAGAGPQPVDVDVTFTSQPDAYSAIHLMPQAGTGNCVDWHACYGKRAATQTNVAARYYDGAAWQVPSWGNDRVFALSIWRDGVDLDPDQGQLLTSGMCYNGAWINLYGHGQTNGLAVFHEISDADPFRHGNVIYRPHTPEFGDMMGLIRINTTLPARGQITYVELPSDW